MGIEQYRDRVAARVTQAMTHSGVDLSSIPAGQQERLTNAVTDGMLFEFDEILDGLNRQVATSAASATAANTEVATASALDSHEEQIVWEGRPFLSLGESYQVTNDRIRLFNGLIARNVENIELIRLQDIDYRQGVSERILGIGDIFLHSADASEPVVTLRNVRDPESVTNIIRKAWLDARRRRGVVFRDIV